MTDERRSADVLYNEMPRRAYTHLDEAHHGAHEALRTLLERRLGIARAVLIDDLYGLIRVILWLTEGADEAALRERVSAALREACDQFWTGDVWICSDKTSPSDRLLYDAAWDEGKEDSEVEELRIDDRHRTRSAWFTKFRKPPWEARGGDDTARQGPPIVVFWSFKGGVGRTTALAAFAIQRARAGEKVVVIDFDLDAPGVGTLLAADERGTIAGWGVVDYLLEQPFGSPPLLDYAHRCADADVTGEGAIWVLPAGRLDENYLTKLSRVDLEITSPEQPHPLDALLNALCPDPQATPPTSVAAIDLNSPANPDWILLDSRAGLSPGAGLLLRGFAHLHVLFSTTNEQSLQGLQRVVHALGEERLRDDDTQSDCLVVQAMVPNSPNVAIEAERAFRTRLEAIFREDYLVVEGDDPEDRMWSVRDLDNTEAPHVPIPIPYQPGFAFFVGLRGIADPLATEVWYQHLASRILNRFPSSTTKEEPKDDGIADS